MQGIDNLVRSFCVQIENRVLGAGIVKRPGAYFKVEEDVYEVRFLFSNDNTQATLVLPKPYVSNGVQFIKTASCIRPTCLYHHRDSKRTFDFVGCMTELLLGNTEVVVPEEIYRSKTNILQSIKFGYDNDNISYVIYNVQKAVNYIVNRLPLHETFMKSFVVNHRIVVLDKEFDKLKSPEDKHLYQIEKNREYFKYGWTSLGLADGTLAGNNYLLDIDLRKLSPFGLKHHNPQRNLYSTLGMRGPERPLVKSQSAAVLENHGIVRGGWNFFTLFLDIPDVWEDQILISSRFKDKLFIEYEKRMTCFGELLVTEGMQLKDGDPLYNAEGEITKLNLKCEQAEVISVAKDLKTVFGGRVHLSHEVLIRYRRYVTDGTKITNTAANKGVLRFMDLGVAIDPKTGAERPIDIIVSGKAVLKRKNYTQILEALTNNLCGEKEAIIPDEYGATEEEIKASLTKAGYPEDGCWVCNTPWGNNLKGIAGKVFWGVTHDAQDTVWTKEEILRTNNRGERISGQKFSTIEFRALRTRFGRNNPIEKEILSHAHDTTTLLEHLNVLRAKLGHYVLNEKTIEALKLREARATGGSLYEEADLQGTIADPSLPRKGFMLKLVVKYQLLVGENNKILHEGFPTVETERIGDDKVIKEVTLDSIYIPAQTLRKSWTHPSGLKGLSDVASLINNIIRFNNLYAKTNDSTNLGLLYRALYAYFKHVEHKLGGKTGIISNHGLSVRYPHSAKAVATLSNTLPENTVQIHRDMAETLGVEDGEVVLVERFPCLGFMSLRPQKVNVTDDPLCKYTIRASGNSLGSLTLDFDGDVLFISSFKTEEAKKALEEEWETPNKHCYAYILEYNAKMGIPHLQEFDLTDYKIHIFPQLTVDTHSAIVDKLTGVKSYTGPVVALAYDLLRLMESVEEENQETWCGIEVFMDTVANSVFKQKHGKQSLHKVVTEAVCSADYDKLVEHGFDPKISRRICNVIIEKAKEKGITDLKRGGNGSSNILKRFVKEDNRLYFGSRAILNSAEILDIYDTYKIIDIPSTIFSKILNGGNNNAKGTRTHIKQVDWNRKSDRKTGNQQWMGKTLHEDDGCRTPAGWLVEGSGMHHPADDKQRKDREDYRRVCGRRATALRRGLYQKLAERPRDSRIWGDDQPSQTRFENHV